MTYMYVKGVTHSVERMNSTCRSFTELYRDFFGSSFRFLCPAALLFWFIPVTLMVLCSAAAGTALNASRPAPNSRQANLATSCEAEPRDLSLMLPPVVISFRTPVSLATCRCQTDNLTRPERMMLTTCECVLPATSDAVIVVIV